MRSAPPYSPLDDRAFVFAPHWRGCGEAGAAVASRRRAESAGRAFAARPAAEKPSAPRPLTWILAGVAAWALLIGGRMQIVRLAPATAPLYAALGLDVNLRRMDIEHVVSRLANENGRQVLIVEGEIRNLASSPRRAPRMRLAVLDADGREIYHWTAAPPKARLAAGEMAEFRARLAAPPREGREALVRFAGDAGASGASW